MKKLFYIVAFALLTGSCANESKVTKSAVAGNFETGRIIPRVQIAHDTTQSYALYLPANYSDTGSYKVIIFFDPHAEGTLPLNMYRHVADKHRIIMLGSNDSKNGMDPAKSVSVGKNLVKEAVTKFAGGQSIIACGFSGGAKVALATGTTEANVSDVIYCGGATHVEPNHAVHLIGVAGIRDMNYADVVQFDRHFNGTPVKHSFIEWEGRHEFPAAAVFEDAYRLTQGATLAEIKRAPASAPAAELEEEQLLKQRYLSALQNGDVAWWKSEIARLELKRAKHPMSDRLLDYISLACYSVTVHALQQNELAFAEQILTIYKLADPDNKACRELQVELERKMGQKRP